jgi:hypothetical protein
MISARNLLFLNFILLSACTQGQPDRGSAAQQEACRQRADEVFLKQNPNEQYRTDLYVSGQRDTPFGGTGVNDPTAGLGASYARSRLLDNCLRNVNAKPADRPAAAKP